MPSLQGMKRPHKFFSVWFLISLFWVLGTGAWTMPEWSKDALAITEFNYEITEDRFPLLKGRHGKVELFETQGRTEDRATWNLALHLTGIFGLPLLGLGLGIRHIRRPD